MRKYRNIPAMSTTSGAYDTVSDGISPPTQTHDIGAHEVYDDDDIPPFNPDRTPGMQQFLDTNGAGIRPDTMALDPPSISAVALPEHVGFYKETYEKLYQEVVQEREALKQKALNLDQQYADQKFLEDTKNVSELKKFKNYVLTLISKRIAAKKSLERIQQNPESQIEFKVSHQFRNPQLKDLVEKEKRKFQENYVATVINDLKSHMNDLNTKIRSAPQELLDVLQNNLLQESNDIVRGIANNKAVYAKMELEKFITQQQVNSSLNTVNFSKKIDEIYYFIGHKAKEEDRKDGYWRKDKIEEEISERKVKTSSKKVNILTSTEIPEQIINLLTLGSNFNLFLKPNPKEFSETIQQIKWKILEEISYKYRENFKQKEEKLKTMNNIFSLNFSSFKSSSLNILKTYKPHKGYNFKIERAKKFLSHHNLLVKPADKNLGLTILDKNWYINEIYRQLNTPDYVKTDFNLLDMCETFSHYFERWKDRYNHSAKLIEKWKPNLNKNHFPQIYILPKIHKNPVKGRPIIPCCGWVTEPLSRYLSKKLRPFVNDSPFTVLDTVSAVNRLNNYKSTKKPILVALDVESMYTKINTDEGLEVLQNYLYGHRGNRTTYILDWYLFLLKFILKNNYFEFLGERYLQVSGTAMGTPVAPEYANLFMCYFEEILKYKEPDLFPEIYMRYLDDMLFVWEKSESDLLLFIDKLNNMSPSLKLTFTYSDKVQFLDLNLSIIQTHGSEYRIEIDTFDKPTNLHLYTDPNSYAPYRYRYNWIIGEHIRIIRTNSTKDNYLNNILKFKENLLKRHYKLNNVEHLLKRHNYEDRHRLLNREISDEDLSARNFIKMPNIPGRHLIERYFKNVLKKYNSIEFIDPLRITFIVTAGKTLLNVLEVHNKGKLMESQDEIL